MSYVPASPEEFSAEEDRDFRDALRGGDQDGAKQVVGSVAAGLEDGNLEDASFQC